MENRLSWMTPVVALLLALVVLRPVAARAAETPLPALHDGSVVTGPGVFVHNGLLRIQGSVVLRHLVLDLRGPIQVAAGARLTLDGVHLRISDPPGMPNGTSGLNCEGPASITIRNSTMRPLGTAHPMWELRGTLHVDGFQTLNSEFHLHGVKATISHLRIFELQLHPGTQLTGSDLDLVFFSDFVAPSDHIRFAGIPSSQWFSRTLPMGGGAVARLTHARAQIFLVYVLGHSDVSLAHLGRVQIALFPTCRGALSLPRGHLGSAAHPAVFPAPGETNCGFHLSLNDVHVDTWDVYTGGHADLTLNHSYIDELGANGDARVRVRHSVLFADWLAVGDHARLDVADSRVGALSMVKERPDLATSQVRVTGDAQATFSRVRFDCGVYAGGHARVTIREALTPPRSLRQEQQATILSSPAASVSSK